MSSGEAESPRSGVQPRPQPVFPGLHGRRRREPHEVASHQRGRLIGATLEACARHGWATTTVEELVALAGVSKTSFYEHFANKDECFLASFEAVVEAASAQIGEAYRGRRGLRGRLSAGMESFAEIVAERPGAAQLVVIESLGLGAAAVPQRDAAAELFETMFRQSFEEAHGPGAVDELTVRALVGGVRRVVYRELRAGRPEGLRRHADALAEWAMGYAEAAGEAPIRRPAPPRPVSEVEQTLPWAEPPSSDAARAVLTQRERLVRATAIAVTERGYGAASIATISTIAGVSKETFYQHFEGKEAAFLAAYDAIAERALGVTAAAFSMQPHWAEGVEAGLTALLEHIAGNRIYARLAFFELPAAGPAALDRADASLEAFGAFLDPTAVGAKSPRRPPAVVIEAISGGAWAVIQHEIAAGRASTLPALGPRIARLVLVPFGCARGDA